jgi:hypothetical protein
LPLTTAVPNSPLAVDIAASFDHDDVVSAAWTVVLGITMLMAGKRVNVISRIATSWACLVIDLHQQVVLLARYVAL